MQKHLYYSMKNRAHRKERSDSDEPRFHPPYMMPFRVPGCQPFFENPPEIAREQDFSAQ
jgi:hypothetical protein